MLAHHLRSSNRSSIRALNARGSRATARVLPVRPTTVLKALKKRHLRSLRCIRRCYSASILRRWRWSSGVRMRWRCVGEAALRWTRCGAMCVAKRSRAGYGMREITTRVRCEPLGVDDARTGPFWSSKRSWNRVVSRAILPPVGEPTSGIWRPSSTRSGRPTRRRSRANTSIDARGSSSWYVGGSVCPRRNVCTTW